MVGQLGLEPRTYGLKVRCSTIELLALVWLLVFKYALRHLFPCSCWVFSTLVYDAVGLFLPARRETAPPLDKTLVVSRIREGLTVLWGAFLS